MFVGVNLEKDLLQRFLYYKKDMTEYCKTDMTALQNTLGAYCQNSLHGVK